MVDECEFYLHNSELERYIAPSISCYTPFKPFKIHHAKTVDLCAKAVKGRNFYDPDWAKFENAELLRSIRWRVKAYGTAFFVYGFITWCSKVLGKITLGPLL